MVDELDKGGFTAAARCLADDLDALVVHLRYPVRHRRRWRSTNLLERSLGEVKRRTKVMGRFPGETSCLTHIWAVLHLLITHQTTSINFNALDANASNERATTAPTKPSPRRRQPPKLTITREPNLQRQRDAAALCAESRDHREAGVLAQEPSNLLVAKLGSRAGGRTHGIRNASAGVGNPTSARLASASVRNIRGAGACSGRLPPRTSSGRPRKPRLRR